MSEPSLLPPDPAVSAPACTECAAPVFTGLSVCWRHIASELGITYRQLDTWSRCGWLRPEHPPSRHGDSGSGAPRRWTEEELEIARRMGRLTSAGLAVANAAAFARGSWPAGEIGPGLVLTAAGPGLPPVLAAAVELEDAEAGRG